MEPIVEEILELVKKKMEEQAAYTHESYRELVEETIEYFKEKGKITDDDNDRFIEEQLLAMWGAVEDQFAVK